IDFFATGEEVTVSLGLPQNPPGFRTFTEQAASPGYGWSVIEEQHTQRGEWTKRSASGPQTLYYKAQFAGGLDKETEVSSEHIPGAKPVEWDGPQATASTQLLAQALSTSSNSNSLARELTKLLNDPAPDQNASLML